MIYLVRHGQTDWNVQGKTQGHTDIPLNDNGREQIRKLAKKIEKLKIDKIYSSDLSRAKETAEIINTKFRKKIVFDKRLREICYGKLEGISRNTLTPEIWQNYHSNPEEFNAENKNDIYFRVKSFFDEKQNEKENILIVTHGGLLRMIMYYAKNKNEFNDNYFLQEFKNVEIKNSDIFEWGSEFKMFSEAK